MKKPIKNIAKVAAIGAGVGASVGYPLGYLLPNNLVKRPEKIS